MNTALLSISYLILAGVVTLLSVKLADYVDIIDKKTDISGAFIGGVVLAAVTSLPELFTSFSAVVIVKEAGLVFGNILGSNLFNVSILAMIVLIAAKGFSRAKVGGSHLKITYFTLFLFALMFLADVLKVDFCFLNISVYTVIIIITYILSIRFMAVDETGNDEDTDSPLTVRQIAVRFVILAIVLVGASVLVTVVTDKLSVRLSLGATVAGALFLGIATSLPELTSTIALARKGNYNAAVGNILGSGVFNFCILAVSDLLYRRGTVYSSGGTSSLVIFGFIATALAAAILIIKKRSGESEKTAPFYRILSAGILACYVLFIVMS